MSAGWRPEWVHGDDRLTDDVDEESTGGLPTGWTQDDADPASVYTNGGALIAGAEVGNQVVALFPAGVNVTRPSDGQTVLSVNTDTNDKVETRGVVSRSETGTAAFEANSANGATVALDAGGLTAINLSQVVVTGPPSDNGLVVKYDSGQSAIVAGDDNGGVNVTSPSNASFVQATDAAVVLQSSGAVSVQGDEIGLLGFYSATPVARPVVPLTGPTVQDVIDALVALGLVSQSD